MKNIMNYEEKHLKKTIIYIYIYIYIYIIYIYDISNFIDSLASLNHLPCINKPTHNTRHSSTIICNIFACYVLSYK